VQEQNYKQKTTIIMTTITSNSYQSRVYSTPKNGTQIIDVNWKTKTSIHWLNVWLTIIPAVSFVCMNYIPTIKNSTEMSGIFALVFSVSGALFLYSFANKNYKPKHYD
jgi:hypothetical protein